MSWKDRAPFLPTKGGIALLFLVLGIFGAAQTTGAGWLTVLASLGVGTLATGAIWPIILIRSSSLEISAMVDVVVGRPFPLTVRIDRPTAGIQFEIRSIAGEPFWALPPTTGTINVTATQRGIFKHLDVDVRCSAPFDLFSARRRLTVDLRDPIYVAPQPIPMRLPDRLLGSSTGDGTGGGGTGQGDMVRGLREYLPGDAMRMVHWRASAGRPDLLVKELEPPERPHVALIVDVSGPNAERIAGEAAGLIQSARREGLPVALSTFEATGPVIGDVGSMREAGRRLAGAVSGRPATGPFPVGAEVIEVARQAGGGQS